METKRSSKLQVVLDMKHVLYGVWIEIEGCGILSRTIGMGPAYIDYGQSCIHPITKPGIDKGLIISLKPVLDNGSIDLPVIDVVDQVVIVKIFRLQGRIYPVYPIV